MESNGKRLFEAAIIAEGGLRIDATFHADSTIDAIRHIQDAFVFSCGPLTARHTCTVRPAYPSLSAAVNLQEGAQRALR